MDITEALKYIPAWLIIILSFGVVIISILYICGVIHIGIMAPCWANNILNELKKHTKELEEIKKANTAIPSTREEKSKEYFG